MNEHLLDQGERFFRELADNAPVMIWRSGLDKLCDWFNKPWLDFVGRTMEQESGNGWTENVHADDFDRCLEIYTSSFDARRPFSMVYRLRRSDGIYREVLDNGAPFHRAGVFAGYFGSCIDVTDQRLAEAQLRQAAKMEALGRLTGGIAHDFNNIMQIIMSNIEMISAPIAADPKNSRRLGMILQAISRGSNFASQLLAFARRQPLSPKVVNFDRLVRNAENMLRHALGEGIEIEMVLADGLWNTFADPAQVETTLLNLAINARDAMEGRGKLTIEVRNAVIDDRHASRQTAAQLGQYVVIAVSDTGSGIKPEILERVFDPFFTTKPEGQGTGLGLSMAHGFVKQSGGHVNIESELGKGTTVRIYLPRIRQSEAVPARHSTSPAVNRTETILLVEDDEDVRSATADTLSGMGYSVLQAQDADNAVEIIESDVAFDLLFTDVVMPGPVRAQELVGKLKQMRPGVAVLFTSGYTDDDALFSSEMDGGGYFIAKPYTLEELRQKLDQILHQKD